MSSDPQKDAAMPGGEFIGRSPETIRFLSPEFRWEFTRRHTYYLLFWQSAQRHRLAPSTDPRQSEADELAYHILLCIGVTGVAVDPAIPFSKLDEDPLPQAWINGAVAPQSIRALSALLLHLPSNVQQLVGQLLIDASKLSADDIAGRMELVRRLVQFQDQELDAYPDATLVAINPEAPLRAITEAVESYIRERKETLDIPERRRRVDTYPDCLAVWDRMEGWDGSTYKGGRELTLSQTAMQLNVPVETARNRYHSAFRWITGHEYTPELWDKFFGTPKLRGDFGPLDTSWKSLRRRTQSSTGSEQIEPRVTIDIPVADGSDLIEVDEIDAGQVKDLAGELRKGIAAGASNEEIIKSLGLEDPAAGRMIDHFRTRTAERL